MISLRKFRRLNKWGRLLDHWALSVFGWWTFCSYRFRLYHHRWLDHRGLSWLLLKISQFRSYHHFGALWINLWLRHNKADWRKLLYYIKVMNQLLLIPFRWEPRRRTISGKSATYSRWGCMPLVVLCDILTPASWLRLLLLLLNLLLSSKLLLSLLKVLVLLLAKEWPTQFLSTLPQFFHEINLAHLFY